MTRELPAPSSNSEQSGGSETITSESHRSILERIEEKLNRVLGDEDERRFALAAHDRADQARAQAPIRRRAVIGHLKAEHRMGRNYLAHASGDASNAVLAAVGYNLRRLIAWLALLCAHILATLFAPLPATPQSRLA